MHSTSGQPAPEPVRQGASPFLEPASLPESVRELRELYRSAEARASRLRLLADAGRDLTGMQPLAEALKAVLGRAMAFGGFASGLIETDIPVLHVTRGEPVLADGAETDLVLTLVAADAVGLGRIVLRSRTRRAALDPGDTETLHILAGQVAAAVVTVARNAEREFLVGRLLTLQEEERRRVSQEVHDGIAQVAAGVHQHLDAFVERHRTDLREMADELDPIVALARRTVREARRVMAGLRPTVLDDFGLVQAIRLDLDHLREAKWTTRLTDELGEPRLPLAVETTLYRVVQEALANARKHSRTKTVTVSLRRREGSVRLVVADEGIGFDPSGVASDPSRAERIGLMVMRERVAWLGGTFTLRSAPERGTRVSVELPLKDGDAS